MHETPIQLPAKPQPPKDYNCCGGGCADCDLRLYLRRLKEWQQQMIMLGLPRD